MLKASVRYRATALALCLLIIDVWVEVIRQIYPEKSDALILGIQGSLAKDATGNTHQYVSKITELSGLNDLREIQALLQ